MKKTLLNLISLISLTAFSQVNVSFETTEGYSLAAINTQGPVGNTWGLLNSTATNTMNSTLANVANNRAITGMVKDKVISRQITLQRLADFGVPEDITLPYETEELRRLVQELAQNEVY